jgi:hypothetical protein
MWTIQRVKYELPTVKVAVGKNQFEARIVGSSLQFPFVVWGETNKIEVSWQTLVNCLNNNKPVKI